MLGMCLHHVSHSPIPAFRWSGPTRSAPPIRTAQSPPSDPRRVSASGKRWIQLTLLFPHTPKFFLKKAYPKIPTQKKEQIFSLFPNILRHCNAKDEELESSRRLLEFSSPQLGKFLRFFSAGSEISMFTFVFFFLIKGFALMEGLGTGSFPPDQSCFLRSPNLVIFSSPDLFNANLGGWWCLRARHWFGFKLACLLRRLVLWVLGFHGSLIRFRGCCC